MVETAQSPALWSWDPQIAAIAGVPAEFVPAPGELLMLDTEMPPLTDEEVARLRTHGENGENALSEYLLQRHKRLWKAREDPFRFGWELPHWGVIRHYLQQRDEIFVFGANDSAKSKFLARIVCQVLFRRITWPGMMSGPAKVLCIAQNDSVSKAIQQSAIYDELPSSLRVWNNQTSKKRSPIMKLNYSQSDGFTGGTFVLANPRGSQCWFRNVAQYEHGELSFEGAAYHLVAIDEDLPLSMLEALQFRAAKTNGKILYCFTSVKGFNSIARNVLTGARVIQSLPMNWDVFRKA